VSTSLGAPASKVARPLEDYDDVGGSGSNSSSFIDGMWSGMVPNTRLAPGMNVRT
jgi:hypothetical protein